MVRRGLTDQIDQKASNGSHQADAAEVLYRATVRVRSLGGPDKHVSFAVDEAEAIMGMSGSLADFYGAQAGTFTPRASTLDYLVGATAGCLLGTFCRALAARKVTVAPDDLAADAVGDVVVEDGVPQLKRIVVRYRLKVAPETDLDAVDRAHAFHHRACAVSRSLEAAIAISTELELLHN
jgi:uncharacterized OsmC-like protein